MPPQSVSVPQSSLEGRCSQPVASNCKDLHFHQSLASPSSQGVLTKYIYCTKVLSQYWSDQFSCIDCLLRAWLYQGQSILTETASCVLHDAHTIAQNTIARCTLLHGILSTTYYCMAWILLHDAHCISHGTLLHVYTLLHGTHSIALDSTAQLVLHYSTLSNWTHFCPIAHWQNCTTAQCTMWSKCPATTQVHPLICGTRLCQAENSSSAEDCSQRNLFLEFKKLYQTSFSMHTDGLTSLGTLGRWTLALTSSALGREIHDVWQLKCSKLL